MRRNDRAISKRASVRRPGRLALLALVFAALGCEDERSKKPVAPAADTASPVPAATVPAKKESAPVLELDTIGAKVGTERALLMHPEGKAELTALLTGAKRWIESQEVVLIVDRKTKVPWVVTYLEELGKLGPSKITIRTPTRKEYSQDQRFIPEAKVQAPPCSVVGMVTSDYATAVWKLSGGTAGKRPKGMAGPDLSMTGDSIERFAKGCKDSSTFFVQVAEGIEWGLAFDLGASSRVLEHAKFDATVLLSEIPTPGHKVALKR